VTSHSEIARKLHVRCTCSFKALKRFAFITKELNIPWYPGIGSVLSGDESFLPAACALFELPSTAADLSWKPVSHPPPWFRSDENAGSSTSTMARLRCYI